MGLFPLADSKSMFYINKKSILFKLREFLILIQIDRVKFKFNNWIGLRMSYDKIIFNRDKEKRKKRKRTEQKFIGYEFCSQLFGQNMNKWIPNVI